MAKKIKLTSHFGSYLVLKSQNKVGRSTKLENDSSNFVEYKN